MRIQDKHIFLGYKGSFNMWTVAQNISFSFFHLGRHRRPPLCWQCNPPMPVHGGALPPLYSSHPHLPVLLLLEDLLRFFQLLNTVDPHYSRFCMCKFTYPLKCLNPHIRNRQRFPSHSGTCTEQQKLWVAWCAHFQLRLNKATFSPLVSALMI